MILEEIKMVEDTPDELLGELFNAAYFPNHPLGRPIEGTEDTVSTFDQQLTTDFHAHAFSRANLVVAAAGKRRAQPGCGDGGTGFADANKNADASQISAEATVSPAPAAPILIEHKKELEQAHLIVATPFPTALSPERHAASLLASIIGGGTSSRLWQKIREERGLAYSVGAGSGTFRCWCLHNLCRYLSQTPR